MTGMGGVGKTALATVLANRLKNRWPDAQLCMNLRGADPDHREPVTPADALQLIIHAFHPEARLPDTIDALTPIYHSVLSTSGKVLLLLDNASDADQVKPLLPPANCLLLVTSRKQIQLPGLTPKNIDCLKPKKAQKLLLELAPRLQGNEVEAATLCGCLPLALECFAGAVNDKKLYPMPELLARLRDRKDKLDAVDAAFDLSYELLDDQAKHRWTTLSVFPASFDLRAAAAIWEISEEEARTPMQDLLNASLVEWNQTNQRFRLHDLVRQFCHEKLKDEERERARFLHASHYAAIGAEADQLYLKGGENIVRGLELFDRERANLESAFERARGQRDDAFARLVGSLVDGVVYVASLRFHPNQRIRWLEAQLNAARILKDRPGESYALGNLGNAYRDLGEVKKAIEYYEQALAIAREIGDRRGEGNALGNLGTAYRHLDEVKKAIEYLEQRLVIAREIGDRRGEGNALGNLGSAYFDSGELKRAIEYYEQRLAIAREIGDRRGEGNALGNIGSAYRVLGEVKKAIEYYDQHLAIARETGDRHGEGTTLGNLGNAYADLGEVKKAIEYYEQALAIARDIGDRRGEGRTLWNMALDIDGLGKRDEAIAHANAALKILGAIESPLAAKVRAKLAEWRGQS